ncbi:MAG: YceI family protein [Bryobacteraceae bacterium]
MMKLLAAIVSVGLAAAETYTIQPAAGSEFRLYITKTGPIMGGKKHDLLFERYQGKLEYDAAAPEKSSVEFAVESGSMVVKDDWVKQGQLKDIRDEALGKNGLEAEKHSKITFKSSSTGKAPDGSFGVHGTLTIRGIAKPAVVTVKLGGEGARLTLDGTSKVKLTDYGIKPPKAALGLVGTQDEMEVRFRVVAAK